MTCRGHVRAAMCALSGNAARKSSLGGTEPQRESPPTERSPTNRRGRPPGRPAHDYRTPGIVILSLWRRILKGKDPSVAPLPQDDSEGGALPPRSCHLPVAPLRGSTPPPRCHLEPSAKDLARGGSAQDDKKGGKAAQTANPPFYQKFSTTRRTYT